MNPGITSLSKKFWDNLFPNQIPSGEMIREVKVWTLNWKCLTYIAQFSWNAYLYYFHYRHVCLFLSQLSLETSTLQLPQVWFCTIGQEREYPHKILNILTARWHSVWVFTVFSHTSHNVCLRGTCIHGTQTTKCAITCCQTLFLQLQILSPTT